MKIEFKFENKQLVEDKLGRKGIITSKRMSDKKKINYWVNFEGTSESINEEDIKGETSKNEVDFKFDIYDIVVDEVLEIKGRVHYFAKDDDKTISVLIETKYGRFWKREDILNKIIVN